MVSRPAMDRLAGLRNQPEPEPNWCILNLPRLSGQSARIKTNGVGSLLAGLFGLVIFLNAVTGLLAQSVWTNLAVGAWGVAANWSPNGIPNAMDAVVTTANVLIVTTNVNGSGTFPYTFGTLNCGSGPLGTASGASPSRSASSVPVRSPSPPHPAALPPLNTVSTPLSQRCAAFQFWCESGPQLNVRWWCACRGQG